MYNGTINFISDKTPETFPKNSMIYFFPELPNGM